MLHFDTPIFGIRMWWHFLWKTQIPSNSTDVNHWNPVEKGHLVTWHWRHGLEIYHRLALTGFTRRQCCNIAVFSCSQHSAQCGHVWSGRLQLRGLHLQWNIISKYRSLLLLFRVLKAQIALWNSSVGKGMKQRCDGNWICWNTVTQYIFLYMSFRAS